MNPTRQQNMVDGLSSTAAKVFEAVPIRDQWDVRQIMLELARQGHRYALDRVSGCLKSLVDQGLIKEYRGGTFKRIDVTKRPAICTIREISPVTILHPTQQPKEKPDPMDELARIAMNLRERGKALIEEADAVEAAALEMQQKIEQASGENSKLAQLRNLLKDI